MADPRLPEGFGASPDPIKENPFKKGDPRHRVWEGSTRTAETAVHQFTADHLEVFPIDSVDQPLWHVDHLSRKFDIWAERRRVLPQVGGLDFSPLVLLIALQFLRRLL